MDFPAYATTNVHIVKNVDKIHWTLFSKIVSETPRLLEFDHGVDLRLSTIETVYGLRQRHSHVYHDLAKDQICVFNLIEPGDGPNEEFLLTLGFSRASTGTLYSSDLYSMAPRDGVLSDPHNVGNIYDKAMLAISSTLNHFLAKSDDWMIFGNNTCINSCSLDDQPFGDKWLDPDAEQTIVVRFEAEWDAASQLTLSSSFLQCGRLCRIARRLLESGPAIRIDSPVLLCPSGTSGKYRGFLPAPESGLTYGRFENMKMQCTYYLNQMGFSITADSEWIQVEVADMQSTSPDNGFEFNETKLTIWPAKLTFCRDTSSTGNEVIFPGSEQLGIADPLTRAESWFSGKALRANEVADAEKEAQSAAIRLSTIPDAHRIDTLSEFASPNVHDVAPPDMSVLYPTPPDGLLSQIVDALGDNDQRESPTNDLGQEQRSEGYGVSGYQDSSNQNIFDNMDMDMLTGNDLTAEDFNFFDDPGMENEPSSAILEDEATLTHLKEPQIRGLTSNNAKNPAPPVNEHSHEGAEMDQDMNEEVSVNEVPQSAHGLDGNFQTNTTQIEDKDNGGDSLAHAALREIDLQELSKMSTSLEYPSSFTRGQTSKRSFNAMFLLNLGFDSKYGTLGRFGFPLATSESNGQYLRKRPSEQQVPKLGIKRSSPTSPGSGDETDEDSGDSQILKFHDIEVSENIGGSSEPIYQKPDRISANKPINSGSPNSQGPAFQEPAQQSLHGLSAPPSDLYDWAVDHKILNLNLPQLETPTPPFISKDQSFIQIAQLVADQVALGTFTKTDMHSEQTWKANSLHHQALTDVISEIFPLSQHCSLIDLIGLPDQHGEAIRNPKNPDPKRRIYKLESSFAGVRRMGTMTDILLSATPFWEELSLGPCSGPKNINAFCIFPKHDYLVEPARAFLEMMKGAYQVCNLGRHNLDSPQSRYPYGLFPVSTDENGIMKDLKLSCATFGKYLAERDMSDGVNVFYFVDLWDDDVATVAFCSAFLDLYKSYRSTLEQKEEAKCLNDLVLQIVPSNLVFSRNRLVIPSLSKYKQLAFEVYGRCGPTSVDLPAVNSPYICAPAVRLSKSIPKAIDFKLASNSSLAVLDIDECLHLAYEWKIGEHWLTASWVNNLGTLEWNSAYWLSKDDNIWESLSQAFREMWETTRDMLRPGRTNCKLYIAKHCPIEKREVEGKFAAGVRRLKGLIELEWNSLITKDGAMARVALVIVDENPSLSLFQAKQSDPISEPPDLFATPESTPHASGQSPEVSNHLATPGGSAVQGHTNISGEIDVDAKLIDVIDETWAVFSDRRGVDLDATINRPKMRPKGYLIKRGGTGDQDGLLPIQLDIVIASDPLLSVLKEALSTYRNLASLARARNLVHPVTGTLPVHIAAAIKTHTILCRTMKYGG